MGRSQRHKLFVQSNTTRGDIYAQGMYAPGAAQQTPPPPVVKTIGPGGPLTGSTTGAVPVGWTTPVPHDELS